MFIHLKPELLFKWLSKIRYLLLLINTAELLLIKFGEKYELFPPITSLYFWLIIYYLDVSMCSFFLHKFCLPFFQPQTEHQWHMVAVLRNEELSSDIFLYAAPQLSRCSGLFNHNMNSALGIIPWIIPLLRKLGNEIRFFFPLRHLPIISHAQNTKLIS